MKFTIIQTISDNGLNVKFEHVKAKSAKKALQHSLTNGFEGATVIAIVPGWVEKALEDDDIEEVVEEIDNCY